MAAGMILAAGLGTRLRPLTEELPKPLVPLGDRPMIAHVAIRLRAAGLAPLAMNTHHLAPAFARAGLDALGVAIAHEPAILGTAGGVANARPLLGAGDVLVWNGDLAAEVDVGGLLVAQARAPALATLVVAPRAKGEGTVGLDARGDVVRLRGESFGVEASGGDFLGAHLLAAATVASLPPEGCLVGDVYLPALRGGARLGSFAHAGPWDDVGTVAAYLTANLRWLGERASFLAEGASVGPGIALDRVVVGAGAEVAGRGALRRVVVWPGARAEAPLEDAVVTSRGVVRA